MNDLRSSLDRLLESRYGIDELNKSIFVLYLFFFLADLITGDSLFYLFAIITLVIFYFRCFSSNLEAREAENQYCLKYTSKLTKRINLQKRIWKDRNTHVYRRCPHCQTMIRLPKVKGTHTTNCPKCHMDFQVKV